MPEYNPIWGEIVPIRTSRYTTVMSRILPEGKRGSFAIVHKTLLQGNLVYTYDHWGGRMRMGRPDKDFRMVVLEIEGGEDVWMSDSPLEQESLIRPLNNARGDVLTSGLGIGLFSTLVSSRKRIRSITVVEKSPDVIDLVWGHIKTPKMTIVQADLWEYLATTDDKYDYVYVDIWGYWAGAIREIDIAKVAASRLLQPGGRTDVWLQELCHRVKDVLPKEPVRAEPLTTRPPCLLCPKVFRYDYGGLCMDCADSLKVSEVFVESEKGGDKNGN